MDSYELREAFAPDDVVTDRDAIRNSADDDEAGRNLENLLAERRELLATLARVQSLVNNHRRVGHVHRWIDDSCLIDRDAIRRALRGPK